MVRLKLLTGAAIALLCTSCSTNPSHSQEDRKVPGTQTTQQEHTETQDSEESDAIPEADVKGHTSSGHHKSKEHGEKHAEDSSDDHKEHRHDHSFSDPEKWAERWNSPERDAWQKPQEVLRIMNIAEGMRAADIGTGTGYFVPHLSKAVGESGEVVALDISQEMVDYVARTARETGLDNVLAMKVFMGGPNLDDASTDRVLIVNTWHHISAREEYAKKLFAALKPGGTVAIVDYTMDYPSGPPKEIRLEPETVEAELKAGGFEASIVEETLPRQYVVVGTKR